MNLTTEQISAIKELDQLLHPPILANFLTNASREGWREIANHMDALKELLEDKNKGEQLNVKSTNKRIK